MRILSRVTTAEVSLIPKLDSFHWKPNFLSCPSLTRGSPHHQPRTTSHQNPETLRHLAPAWHRHTHSPAHTHRREHRAQHIACCDYSEYELVSADYRSLCQQRLLALTQGQAHVRQSAWRLDDERDLEMATRKPLVVAAGLIAGALFGMHWQSQLIEDYKVSCSPVVLLSVLLGHCVVCVAALSFEFLDSDPHTMCRRVLANLATYCVPCCFVLFIP
jgi:hypothetical protein